MMVCGIPFFLGYLLIALSRLTTGVGFYGIILTGRLFAGYACGSASLVVPVSVCLCVRACLRACVRVRVCLHAYIFVRVCTYVCRC